MFAILAFVGMLGVFTFSGALPVQGQTYDAGDAASDRAALVALYNATDGANWGNNGNWLSNAPMGEWHGVITDSDGRVTELSLSFNQLTGEIPAELGGLTNLTHLYLSFNQLTGAIPAELGGLSNLTHLYLGGNQLTGEIPAELGGLTNLTHLYLSFNQLTGAIPAELGGLSNLEWLSLFNNQLTGEIPAELGDLTNLQSLWLQGNQLTGEIPAELGDLTNLELLDLRTNQLTGKIPAELGSLASLEVLDLRTNQLTGKIPAELGDLTNLEGLWLASNQLTGEIPAELGDLTNLELLDLRTNQLTGKIPAELGSLASLEVLDLRTNQLTGKIPAELGDLTNLEGLWLASNQLTGEIPAELGDLTNLELLSLYDNQLTGEIPAELGSLTNLRWLYLSNNQLTGEIPTELGSLTNLEVLSLYDNQLTGEIPAELGSLTNLTELQLRSNQLTGCIPQDLRGVPGNDLSELGLPFCDIPGAVTAGDPLIGRYDTNNNGTIEKNEVIEAIKDYLFGEGDEAISKGDVIRLIKLYLFGPSTPHNRPGAPEGLTAAGNGQTRIYLSWSAPASDGGAAITGYRIEVSENGSTWIDLVANTRNAATRYSHTGLTAGSTRHYRVSAINSAGTGLASNITTGPTATTAGDAATDRAALAALYNATGGANWQNNGNWLSNTPIGEWHGVTTDNDGRVTQLLLSFNQLTGDIPAELGSLTNLEGLSLNFNQLTGEIPAELGSLTNLRWLYLSNNQLTGEIPAELGSLTNLKDLWLFTNQLTGEIPAELDSLTNLVSLYLASNQLVGCIPSGLRDVPRNDLAQLGLNYCMLEGTSPDLVAFVTSVGEGGNLYVGESFTINAEVHNQGTGPAASANLSYYRSTDPIISTSSDTLIGTDVVDPVPVSWTRAESLSRTAPSRTGTYYYYVCVVPVAGESDILNNCSQAFRAQVLERTSPDLVAFVTSVGDGGNLYVGESFTINAEVHNQGTGPAASANLSYYRSTDPIISTSSDTLIGTDVVDPVPVSWTRAESLSRTAPSRTGTYYYYVCVVPVAGESDILNNCSQAFRAQVLERTSPDLVAFVTSVGDGGNLYVGESFTINAEVHNQGTGPAASANLSYYRSTDPIISTSSDTLIGTDVVDPVPVSWTRAESLSRTAPSRTGTYYYYVCVVPVAGESDILNNCSQAFRAQVLERTSPDLVAFVTSVGDGGNLYVGESFTINAEVHNQGTGPAASANLSYYRSTDPIISTSSDTLIGTDVVDPVPVSWTRAESLSRTAPSRTGTYYYYVCVVPVAGESDILNNCSQAFRAQVLERTSPDLVAFVTSVGDGGNLYVGESFTINAEVHNQGTGPAASANLSYYRSTDPIISTSSDTLIGTDVVDPVPVSWTRAESLSRTAPSRTGTYYYYVCVVPVAGESDILNNCSQAFRAQVLERTSPDLVAFVTSVGDGGNLYVGESFTINAEVHNQGTGPAASANLSYYRSTDPIISTSSDTLIGTDVVDPVPVSWTRAESLSRTAPSRTGTYYYYVCVVPVAGESDILNNCSQAFRAQVLERTSPDLVAFVTSVGDGGNLYVGDPSATISARVGNEGDGTSSSTPLRFYFSSDSSITPTDDTLVGEIIVGAIGAGSSRDYSISMTAPSRTGTYYYYVCVVPVAGESDIQNNCQDVGNAVLVQEPVGSSYFDCGRNYTLSFNFPFVGYNYWFEGTIRARTSLSSVTVKTYVDLGFEERGYIGDGDGNLGSMSANQSKDYSVTEFHDILTYTTYTGCDFYLEWEY